MSTKPLRPGSKAPSAPASSTSPTVSTPTPNLLLKRARLQRGWSQQEVADAVGAPHAFMVNRLENGVIFPGPGYRQKLLRLLTVENVQFFPRYSGSTHRVSDVACNQAGMIETSIRCPLTEVAGTPI